MENNDIVTLDVGGEVFITHYSTIKPSVYLRNLFSNKSEQEDNCASFISENKVFIDRDNILFSDIMLYLQTAQLHFTFDGDDDYMLKLEQEAEFYRVDNLVDRIHESINSKRKNRRYYSVSLSSDTIAEGTKSLDSIKTKANIVSSYQYNSSNGTISRVIVSMNPIV